MPKYPLVEIRNSEQENTNLVRKFPFSLQKEMFLF